MWDSAWLVSLGLRRLGRDDLVEDMTRRLVPVMLREGLREYYESRSGRGMGAHDFGWSSLVWEMVEPDPSS